MPEQESIGLLVAVTRRRIKQAVGRRVRPHGLSAQQFGLLVAVVEREGPSLRELAERLRTDQPTTSRIVTTLVRKRLVREEGDPRDRRRRCLRLAAPGRALAERLYPVALELRAAIVGGLSPAERAALRNGLRKIIHNMDRFERGGPAGLRAVSAGRGR
ncbi:MAG TPA: MarR family transcriptional regulator [Vicinamibacteria bacterium]|nr:MarR family transcriptional regulator [Vicinamibacteria bacterium]